MMMVVPIDTDVNEAQNVAQQHRQDRFQRSKVNRVGNFQFQHHDRDDDGKNAITERFEPGCFHPASR
jgi:hypothetical protein